MSEIAKAFADAARRVGRGLAKDFTDAYRGILKDTESKTKQVAEHAAENEAATARDLARSAEKDAHAPHVGDPARPGAAGGHEPGTGAGSYGGAHPGEEGAPHSGAGESGPGQKSEGNGGCITGGDPVDVVSGQMITSAVDVELAGLLPLVLRRAYASDYGGGWLFGTGWSSTLDQHVRVDADGIHYAGDDAQSLRYPPPTAERPRVLPEHGARWPLTWGGPDEAILIEDPDTGWVRRFAPVPGRTEAAVWPLTAMWDRNGHRIEHLYDDGLPVEVRHSGGYRIAVETVLTVGGPRVAGLRLVEGAGPERTTILVDFTWDERGRLAGVLDSSGLPLVYTWDERDRITGWTDRNGHGYAYEYGPDGRVARGFGSGGALDADFVYELDRRGTVVTDSLGHATVYAYDQYGHLTAVTDPLGGVVRTEYDRYGRLLTRTDELGQVTRYRYDAGGRLLRVDHPDGTSVSAEYDPLGLPVRVIDADGAVWRQEFDGRGNRISVTDPTGVTARFDYDEQGRPVRATDPFGHTTLITCDAAGLPIESTDPLGHTTRARRDGFGRVVAATDPLGLTTRLAWTVEGRLTERVAPDGATERWTYDAEGNAITHTDPSGGRTVLEYGPFGQLTARTGLDGARYTFAHDTELRLLQVTDPLGATWDYTYDPAGRLTGETDFNGSAQTYTHDPAGRVAARTNGAGQSVSYRYDPAGRLTSKHTDVGTTAFSYDPSGRLLEATAPDTSLVRRYDRAGLLVEEIVDGRTTSYSYDQVGRRTRRLTPSGAETTWAYDAVGNLTRLTACGHPIAFTHDPLGRETARRIAPDLSLATAWDSANRITAQSLSRIPAGPASPASPAAPTAQDALLHRSYTYRLDGNLIAVTDAGSGTRRFDLDPAGRVTAVNGPGWTETYAYDPLGNLTQADWPTRRDADALGARTYTGTLLGRAGRTRYGYDAAGRTLTRTVTTLSGRTDTWSYAWDADDRLTDVTTPDGTCWHYRYDPLGRRTAKCRLADDGTIVERTEFTWDGTVLAEQTAIGPNLPGPYTLTWDHLGLQPVAQTEYLAPDDSEPGEVDRRFFAIVTDLVGTPTHLLAEDGSTAWNARSALWGATTAPGDSLTTTPLRYPGQYYDPETRLHYNHNRYYDPATARYLTPDPLGLDPAPNPHAYVDNPQTSSDPLGLAPCMQGLEDMASKIHKVLSPRQQEHQTVAAIHVQTPHGPRIFVAGTSKSKLTPAQRKLAEELGAIPLPNDQYIKIKPGEKGGHAEQNLLLFFNRMHANGGTSWSPTHGAASRSVCNDFCAPFIRRAGGRMHGPVHQNESGTKQRQFFWPGMI